MKKIEVVVSERYYVRGGKMFQHFLYDKKYDRFLKNHMLGIYEQFEIKIKQRSLPYHFIKRREEVGKTILEYEYPTDGEKIPNGYFTLFSLLPENTGCDWCEYKNKNIEKICTSFIWCDIKQKSLTHKLKRCSFFRQKKND